VSAEAAATVRERSTFNGDYLLRYLDDAYPYPQSNLFYISTAARCEENPARRDV